MKKLVFVIMILFSMEIRAQIPADNILVNPRAITDSVRSLATSVMALLDLGKEPKMGAILNAKQDEALALLAGDESYEEDVGTGEAGPGLGTVTFDYINTKVLTSTLKTPYSPLNDKLKAGADFKAIVKEMFFIDDAQKATTEKQAEVMKRRTDYLTQVGKHYTQLAYGVHQSLISDMSSISADISGNGSIGATAGMDQTWHAINRALIADIAMQIQLMELDAAKFLSVQPLILMTETPPETETGKGEGEV